MLKQQLFYFVHNEKKRINKLLIDCKKIFNYTINIHNSF